jgi:hypothetical protein
VEPVNEIKEIFESLLDREVEVRNEYARRAAEAARRRAPLGCETCPKKEECKQDVEGYTLFDRCRDELDEELRGLQAEEAADVEALQRDVERELSLLGLKVEFCVDADSRCYFNSPGWPRAYNFYECVSTHRVIDEARKKVYFVDASYKELNYPTYTEYEAVGVDVEERELIDESTPFTAALVENVPWNLIRPTWSRNICNFINELAEAERGGRLLDALKAVKARVEAGSWVYDYQHFLGALRETCEKFNVSL